MNMDLKEKIKIKKLSHKQKLILIFTLSLILFALPQILRTTFHHDSLLGSTTHYHVRISELITSGKTEDPLSFGGRPLTYPPVFPWMINLIPAAKYLLAPLIGATGIIIGYYFTKEIGLTEKQSLYTSIFLFLNPAYAYFSVHLNPRLPALILMVLSYLMITRKEKIINYLSMIPVLIALLMSPIIGISLTVMGAIIFRKKIKKFAAPYTAGFLIFLLGHFLPLINKYGLFQRHEAYDMFVEFNRGVQYFFLETGLTAISFNIALVALAGYGFFKLNDLETKPIREWLLIGIIFSLAVFNRVNDLLIFPVSIIAATVFAGPKLKEFRQSFKLNKVPMKALKATILIYLILAVTIPGLKVITIEPTPEQHEAMIWMKNNTPTNTTILADWNEGHYITNIAERKNVMDPYLEFAPQVDERYNDTRKTMHTHDPNEVIDIMKKYNADYVLQKIKGRRVIQDFSYLQTDERFREVFSNKDYKIYKLMEN